MHGNALHHWPIAMGAHAKERAGAGEADAGFEGETARRREGVDGMEQFVEAIACARAATGGGELHIAERRAAFASRAGSANREGVGDGACLAEDDLAYAAREDGLDFGGEVETFVDGSRDAPAGFDRGGAARAGECRREAGAPGSGGLGCTAGWRASSRR